MDPTLRSLLAAAISLATLGGVAVGRLPGVRVGRTTIALAGAGLLLLTGVVSPQGAIASVNVEVLLLLLALMVVSEALAAAGAFRALTGGVTRRRVGPRQLLVLLVLSSGVASALFLNDTVVLMLTPLVITVTRRTGLPPLPYLLALALAANAGSVATLTGNPQNVLIAVSAGIDYGRFAARLAPVALLSLGAVCLVVLYLFRKDLRLPAAASAHPDTSERGGAHLVRTLLVAAAMVIAFVVGLPVVPTAGAAAVLLLLLELRSAGELLRRVDHGLLLLFAGLFVVVGSLAATDGPALLLGALFPDPGTGAPLALGPLTAVTAGLSTVLSNVPAVLVLIPLLDSADLLAWQRETAALTIAMASTLAGNLTLVASVANLITVEVARKAGVEVGFLEHLRAGAPTTLLTLLLGWAWLVWT